MNAPPPTPELCGSTRLSTACTATAASTAEPPWRSTFSPASTASGLAAVTMTFGPAALAAGAGAGAGASFVAVVAQAARARARGRAAKRWS